MDTVKIIAQIGTINPPPGVRNVTGDPSTFVAGIIRSAILFLIIVAFIIFFIWTIFAGFRFIFAGGDEKSVSGAWSQIYWGLLGMIVVVGSFAIIKLVETFFKVNIISGGFQL